MILNVIIQVLFIYVFINIFNPHCTTNEPNHEKETKMSTKLGFLTYCFIPNLYQGS